MRARRTPAAFAVALCVTPRTDLCSLTQSVTTIPYCVLGAHVGPTQPSRGLLTVFGPGAKR